MHHFCFNIVTPQAVFTLDGTGLMVPHTFSLACIFQVAYETTEAQKDKEQEKSKNQPKKKGWSTGKKVAALAVGGM